MVGYKCAIKHEEAGQEWIIPLLTETHLSNVVNVAVFRWNFPKCPNMILQESVSGIATEKSHTNIFFLVE